MNIPNEPKVCILSFLSTGRRSARVLALLGSALALVPEVRAQVSYFDGENKASPIVLTGLPTNFQVATGSATQSGVVSGIGTLLKIGAGNLTLTANNTYDGGTNIINGTLTIGNGGTTGSVLGNILNNANLTFYRSDDYTFGGVISGSGSVTNLDGILRFSAAQTYTGQTVVSGGSIFVLATTVDQGLSASSLVTINAGSSLDISGRAQTFAGLQGGGTIYSFGGSTGSVNLAVASGETFDFAGVAGGPLTNFSITKSGLGTQILSGVNSYTGGTTVTGGILRVASIGSLGGGAISVTGGALQSTGAFSRNGAVTVDGAASSLSAANFIEIGTTAGSSLTLTNGAQATAATTTAFAVLGGSVGTASVTGAGSMLSSGGVMYVGYLGTGTVTVGAGGSVSAGSLSLGTGVGGSGTFSLNLGGTLFVGGVNGIAAGGGASAFNLAGGVLKVTGSDLTTSVPMTLTNASLIDTSGVTAQFSGVLSGSGGLIKSGGGILKLSAANAYTGGTTILAGLVEFSTLGNLGTSFVSLDGGGVRWATGSSVDITPRLGALGAGSGFFDTNGNNVSFGTALSGAGGLVKLGIGTLTLPVANSYTGGTTVNGGTLAVSSLAPLGSGPISVNSGGLLAFAAPLFLDRTATVSGAGAGLNVTGALEVGSSGSGALTVSSGGVATNSSTVIGANPGRTGTITIDGAGSQLNLGGTLDVGLFGTGTLNLSNGGSLTATKVTLGNFVGSSGTFTLASGATLNVGGANGIAKGTGSGTFHFSGGTIRVVGTALSTTLPFALSGNSAVDTNGLSATFSGVLSGGGGLTKRGAGTLALTGNNTFTGPTSAEAGNLDLVGGSLTTGGTNGLITSGTGLIRLSNTTINLGGSDLTGSAALQFNGTETFNTNGLNATLGGTLGGGGGLTKTGLGTLTFTGTGLGNYNGSTRVNAGTLRLSNGTLIGAVGSLFIAEGAGTTGAMSIDGPGSGFTSGGTFMVGGTGNGALSLTNGGTALATTTVEIGYNTGGGTGALTVDGAGSALTANSFIEVGSSGSGTLTISNGGTVTTLSSAALAVVGGTTGVASVTGANSALNVGTTLYVGYGGAGTLNIGSGGTVTVSGAIQFGNIGGTGTLNLNSGGTLKIGGDGGLAKIGGTANFNLNGGTIKISGTDLSSSLPVPINLLAASTIDTNGLNATLSTVTGSGGFTKIGTGALSFVGNSTYTGTTTVNAGILQIFAGSLNSSPIVMAANTSLIVASGGSLSFPSLTMGTGSTITLNAGSILTLQAPLPRPAGSTITLNGGSTLRIGGTDSLYEVGGAGEFRFAGGTVQVFGSDLTLTHPIPFTLAPFSTVSVDTNGFNANFLSALTGAVVINKVGTGTLTLYGPNTYTGTTNVTGGTLAVVNEVQLGASSVIVGGTGTLAPNSLTFGAAGGFTTLTLNLGGTLQVGGANGIVKAAGAANFTLAGGTIKVVGTTLTTSVPMTLSPANISVIDTNGLGAAFSGALSGTGPFNKAGAGTLTLTGSHPYTGGTLVSGGTLALNDSSGSIIGSGELNVGTGSGNGALSLANGGNIRATIGRFGQTAGRTGTGIVDGSGSRLRLDSYLEVGSAGPGTLDITNGGTVIATTSAAIGVLASASGSAVTVSGTNSALSVGTILYVGVQPTAASLTIGSGGTVTVGTQVLLGADGGTGTLTLNPGGTLQVGGANSLMKGSGTANFNLAGGTLKVLGADLTGNSPATLIGAATIIDTNGFNATLNGGIGGSGSFTKINAGTLTLGGTNTFTGTATISAGTLQIAGGSYTGSLALASGAAFNIGAAGIVTAASPIPRAAGSTVNLLTGGILRVGGLDSIYDDTGTGTFNFSGGTLQITGTDLVWTKSLVFSAPGSALIVDTNGLNGAFTGPLSGAVQLTKTGAGTLALSGTSSHSGNTTVSAGAVEFSTLANFGTGTVTLNGGALRWATGATTDISPRLNALGAGGGTFDTNGNNATLANTISGTGLLTKAGLGALTLAGNNSYSGGTTVQAGTLILGTLTGLGSSTGTITLNGGTLDLGGFSPSTGPVIFNGGNIINGTLGNASSFEIRSGTITASFAGAGTLTKTTPATATLAANSTHSGGTIITGGLVEFSSLGNFGSGTVTMNGGGLRWATGTTTDISPRLTAIGAGGGTFDTNGNNVTLAATIAGSGALAKNGTGTLTLTGNSTHTGGILLNGGNLTLASATGLGGATNRITLNTGILNLGGFNPTLGPVVFNGGEFTNGTLVNAASFEVQTGTLSAVLSGAAAVTKTGTGTFTLNSTNTYAGGTNVNAGILAISGPTNLGSGPVRFGGGTLQLTASGANFAAPFNMLAPSTVDTNGQTATISGLISGAGTFTKAGTGTLTLTGNNTHTGGTSVNGGTLVLASATALGAITNVLTLNGGTIDLGGSNPTTGNVILNGGTFTNGTLVNAAAFELQTGSLATSLTGAGTVTKTGTGTFSLTGAHTYTGGTTVNSGTLLLDGPAASLIGTINVRVNAPGILALNNGATISSPSTAFFDSGTVNIDGAGSVFTTSADIVTSPGGPSVISITNGGRVAAASTVRLGSAATTSGVANVTGAGSRMESAGTLQLGWEGTGTLNIGAGGTVRAGNIVFGAASGSGLFGVPIPGTGVLNLNAGGTLETGGTFGLGLSTRFGVFGGSITYNGTAFVNLSGGTLKTIGTAIVNPHAATLTNASTIDTNGIGASFTGVISGTGSLTKIGAGTLTLSANNTYSGSTTVSGGTVAITSLSNLGTGDIAITTGGIINTGSANLSFARAVTVNGTGSAFTTTGYMEFGTPGNGTLTISNGGAINATTSVTFGGAGVGTGSITGSGSALTTGQLYVGAFAGPGSLTIGSGGTATATTVTLGFSGGNGTLHLNSGGTLQVGGIDGIRSAGTTAFHFAGGLLKVTNSSLTTSVPMTLTNTSTIDTSGVTATLSGSLSGSGALTKTGAGTLTLSSANSYSGGTGIVAGTISVPNAAALGTGPTTIIGGTLQATGPFNTSADITVDGPFAFFTDSSSLDLGATDTDTFTVMNGGTANITGNVSLAAGSGIGALNVTGPGSALNTNGILGIGVFNLGYVTVENGATLTASSVVFGPGGGAGSLNLNTGGTLQVGGTNGIANSGSASFNFAGGLLKVTGSSLTTSVPMTLTNTSIVDTSGVTATLSGSLSGSGGLVKTGGGTLTLPAINSYTGPTIIYGGTLDTGSSGKLTGSSAFNVTGTLLISNASNQPLAAAPLTLDVGTLKFADAVNGASQTLTTLTLDHTATIDFGTGSTGNTFHFSSVIIAPTFTGLSIRNWTPGGTTDHLVFENGFFSPVDLAKISFYDDTNTYLGPATQTAFGGNTQLIPEPASIALLMGAAGILATRRRRARNADSLT